MQIRSARHTRNGAPVGAALCGNRGSRLVFVGQSDLRRLRGAGALTKVVADRVRLLPHHALGRVDEGLLLPADLADTEALAAVRGLDQPVVDAVSLLSRGSRALPGRCLFHRAINPSLVGHATPPRTPHSSRL